MARQVSNVDIITDTWEIVLLKENELLHSLSTEILTANTTAGITGNTDIPRNSELVGAFSANTIAATNALRGGNTSVAANLAITSNVAFTGAAFTSSANGTFSAPQTFSANVTTSGAQLTATSNVYINAANVTINSAAQTFKAGSVNAVAITNDGTTTAVTMAGNTFTVESNVTISGTSHTIAGNVNFDSGTLIVNGSANQVNATSLGLSGLLSVSGNGSVGGTMSTTGNTSLVGGIVSVTTAGTTVSGNVNFDSGTFVINATGNVVNTTSLGVSGVTTLSGNTTISSNVTMNGIATIANTANIVGAATFSNTVGVTGATTLSNTVNVVGAANLQSSANVGSTLGVTGVVTMGANASVAGILSVTGNSSLGMVTSGNTTTTGFVNVAGDTAELRVGNSSNFFTANTTGIYPASNTAGKTLGSTTKRWDIIAGNVAISGTLSGVTSLGAGNTTITGFANVTGSIQGGSTLTIAGAASGITTLAAGNTTITGFINVSSSAKFGGLMEVTGNTTFSDRITVTNSANLAGGLDTAAITATSATIGNSSIQQNSITVGNSTINTAITSTGIDTDGTLAVLGAATLSSTLGVTGNTTVGGTFGATGNTTLGGTLSVTGATTVNAITAAGVAGFNGGLTATTANASTSMAVGANVNLITSRITVGNATVNSFMTSTAFETDGTLTVAGNTSLSGNLSIGTSAGIIANGGIGTAGQVLTSNGTTVYWTTPVTGDITAVSPGNGITGGGTSGDVTINVLANSGIVANSTGTFVRANTGLVANATGLYVDPAANFVNTSGSFTLTGARTMNANLTIGTTATIIANGAAGTAGQILYSNGSTLYWGSVSQGLTAGNGLTSNATHYAVLANSGIVANSTGTFVLANTGLFTNATGVYVNASAISIGTLPDATLPNTAVTVGTYGSGSAVPVITVDSKGRITGVSTSSITAGAATAGSNTQIQFNDSGSLGATAGFTFNKSTNNATIANTLTVGSATINSTAYTGSANDSSYLGGQLPAYYTNATNLTTGTLPYARVPSNIVNTTSSFTFTANQAFNSNVTIAAIIANGSIGTAGQVLHSNGSVIYWAADDTGITSLTTANGLSGGTITTTGTIGIVANTGLFTNATGIYVNASAISIGTLPAATLPTSGATAGQYGSGSLIPVITVDDKGRVTSISTTTSTPGAASPGGSNTNIQFNDSGSLGATAGFTFNKSTNNVTVANTLTVGTATINSSNFTGTANNSTYLNGQLASYYLDSTNLTGTIPYARFPTNIVNTSSSFTFTAVQTFNANVTVATSAGLIANNSRGTAGQVLTSNGTTIYWSDPGDITSVSPGPGMSGGGSSGDVTLSVIANSGIIANATGVYVDAGAISIGTLPYARIPSNIVNTTSSFTFSSTQTFNANATFSSNVAIQGALYSYATLTTTAITETTLATTAYRSATFQIEGVDATSGKYQKTTINAIHNGSTANHVEYGNINIGGDVATFAVDYSAGMRLRVTPASTNSTVFKVVIVYT